jgi:hypothetical protein
VPARITSSPHSSVSIGAPPKEETESTRMSASLSSRTALAISASGLITPVEVSLWTTVTASYLFRRSAARTMSGSTASPQGKETLSADLPTDLEMECQRSANAPFARLRTSAAAQETTALSMIRVELPVATMPSPAVRSTFGSRSEMER